METNYSTGCEPSPYDLRTVTYSGDKAGEAPYEVGESWANTKYIEDQHKVGICTAISMTMKARKHYQRDFSDDFQYLLQKKFIDGNWREGSSALSACKVGNKYGFLPIEDWTHTKIEDRKLPYAEYIKKLQAIPDTEINRLLEISKKYKIQAYAKIANNIDAMASAINENGSVIARFVLDNRWYRRPIEPLRPPLNPISGHLVNITKRSGDSYRVANSWGTDWADGGTAYGIWSQYHPTEMWQVWFADVPQEVQKQLENRDTKIYALLTQVQKLVSLWQKKLKTA
jgi:hypothetical protein